MLSFNVSVPNGVEKTEDQVTSKGSEVLTDMGFHGTG